MGPAIESRTPLAPSIDDSSSGDEMAALAASTARVSPVPWPMPISAEPAPVMTDFTSAKSRLMRPGVVISDVMPSTPWNRTWSAMRNASTIGVLAIGDLKQPVVRNDDQRVDGLLQLGDAEVCLRGALAALEPERPGDDADRERPEPLGDLGDDRSAAGPRTATFAGGDEDHVGALEDLLDLVGVLMRRRPPDLGIGAGAEPSSRLASDVELHFRVRHQERLGIGVDGDELDAPEACLDHPVHRVHTAPADADDLDHGEVVLGSIHHRSVLRTSGPDRPALYLGKRRVRAITITVKLTVIVISTSRIGGNATKKPQVRQASPAAVIVRSDDSATPLTGLTTSPPLRTAVGSRRDPNVGGDHAWLPAPTRSRAARAGPSPSPAVPTASP